MIYDTYEPDSAEADELRAVDRLERRRFNQLMAHPDCMDPDHPGCSRCIESEGDDE